jgi:hypothetical protein
LLQIKQFAIEELHEAHRNELLIYSVDWQLQLKADIKVNVEVQI